MNAPIVDCRQILINNGMASALLFLASEPDRPKITVTLYDTSGEAPNPKWLIDEPTIQIRSKSPSYNTAYANLIQARDILLGLDKLTVNSTQYTGFWATNDILSVKRDDEDRNILVINFRMVREPVSGLNRTPAP